MDLADWAANAAKEIEGIAGELVGEGMQRPPLIKVGDRLGQGEEEAKKLAEDPAFLAERARQNRLLEKLEKALS